MGTQYDRYDTLKNGFLMNIGIDIIEIVRIREAIDRFGTAFLDRVYSSREIAYCSGFSDPYPSYAARFAAKEAYIKYRGGLSGINVNQIEIVNNESGKPWLYVLGKPEQVSVSLSHSRNNAVAVVIGE